jgi:hypothetical protein
MPSWRSAIGSKFRHIDGEPTCVTNLSPILHRPVDVFVLGVLAFLSYVFPGASPEIHETPRTFGSWSSLSRFDVRTPRQTLPANPTFSRRTPHLDIVRIGSCLRTWTSGDSLSGDEATLLDREVPLLDMVNLRPQSVGRRDAYSRLTDNPVEISLGHTIN